MDANQLDKELKELSFPALLDLWLQSKTGRGGLKDELPLNQLLEFMSRLESIIRQQETDDLIAGID